MNYVYKRDREGHVVKKDSLKESTIYAYDSTYQLLNVENKNSENEIFAYDPAGNRTSDADKDYYIYNEDNELLENSGQKLKYDNNGNLVEKSDSNQSVQYKYNIKNRLVSVWTKDGSITASYYYDPFGRRLWKIVNGVKTFYFYSDQGLTGEYDNNGNQVKSYGYKPGSQWTTDPLFIKFKNYDFYINDHIGTPQKVINEKGEVVWSGRYKGFGEVEIEVEDVVNNLRFAGQYYDNENGFYYNMNRYYNFEFGRYNSPDPIGLKGGINFYDYVLNNPVRFFDPLGLLVLENPVLKMPAFVDAVPDSTFFAPTVDMIVGVVEGGAGIAIEVTQVVTFVSGPEFWPETMMIGAVGIETLWDSFNRIKGAVIKLSDSAIEKCKK